MNFWRMIFFYPFLDVDNAVTDLELINADTDVKILHLVDGQVIDWSEVMEGGTSAAPLALNIRAIVSGPVHSVRFVHNDDVHIEYTAPYTLCGNRGADYAVCPELGLGTHVIQATAVSAGDRSISGTLTLSFTIVDSANGNTSMPMPTASPESAPILNPAVVPVLEPPPVSTRPVSATQIPTARPVTAPPIPVDIPPVEAPIMVPEVNTSSPTPVPAPVQSSVPTVPNFVVLPVPTARPVPTLAPVSTPNPSCPVPRFVDEWMGFNTSATVPYPILVSEAQGAMIGPDLVITSGFKDNFGMATTETYALDLFTANATWRRMDDMPFPMGLTHLAVAVKGMTAYFCGGYVGARLGNHNGSCFEYDHAKAPGSGQWTNFTTLPDGGRSGGGMIYDPILDALVYAAGSQRPIRGTKSAVDFNDTWMYSLSDPSAGWVPKARIPFTGNHMNFVTANDEFGRPRHFFFGGQRGDNETRGNTDDMYEYDAVLDTWTRRQSIPYAVGHAAASTRAIGCGFIISGGSVNGGLTSAISYYDIPTDRWTKVGDLTERTHANVCVLANGILRCETGNIDDVFSWMRPVAL